MEKQIFTLLVVLLLGLGDSSHFESPRFSKGPRNIIIVEEANQCCFRRLFTGKKVAPHSIRRSMPVRTQQECEQACLGERQFLCEGFNLRTDNQGFGRGSCELTDVTAHKLGDSLLKNFVEDYEFNYFERKGGSPQCGPSSSSSSSGSSGNTYPGTATFVPSQGPTGGYPQSNQRPPPYPFGPGGKPEGPGGPYDRPGSNNYLPGPNPHGPGPNNYGPGPNPPKNYGPEPNPPNGYGPGPNPPKDYGPRPNPPNGYGPGPNPPKDYGPRPSPPNGYGPGPNPPNGYGPGPNPPNGYGPGPNPPRPGPNGYGPGPNNHGPGPNNYGPGTNSFGPWPDKYGPGNNNYGPGNNFVGPESSYKGANGNNGNWQLFSTSSSQYGGNDRPHDQGPRPGPGYNQGPPQGSWNNNNNQNTVGFYGSTGNNYEGNNYNRPPPPPPPPSYGPNQPPTRPPNGPWNTNDDECFARVWSGQRLDKLAIRSTTSHPSMGGCQLECLQVRDFVCRAYSYRHGPPGEAKDSCILSDRPMQELHPREGLVPDNDFETYERLLGGRGCEHIPPYPPSTPWQMPKPHPTPTEGVPPVKGNDNDPLPPLLVTTMPDIHGRPNLPTPTGQDCYAEYWPSARLSANVVTVATHAPTLPECLSRCTNSQQQWKTPCRSLAYRNGVNGHNCLLSELAQRDLRPNSDFMHDEEKSSGGGDGWRLMAWDWSDEKCRLPGSSTYGGSNSLVPWNDRDKNNWNQRPTSGYGSTSPPSSFSSSSYGGSNYGGSSNFGSSSGYGGGSSPPPPPPPTYSSGGYPGQNNQIGGGGFGGDGGAMTFTVSGKPCASGHVCTMNPNAEFWSCPLDPNSGKDWDYCCSPTHRCGYSEGMQMPWCYVGMSKLQWRPCSERYWPYQNSRMDDREGRFLPVAYLHKSGPPGSEEIYPSRNIYHNHTVTYERLNDRSSVPNSTSTTSTTTTTPRTVTPTTTTIRSTTIKEEQDDSLEMIRVNLTVVDAEI